MLIIGRKVDEVIKIGDDIEIMVTAVKPDGGVNIGIKAPRHVQVMRAELPDGAYPAPKQEEMDL